MVQFGCSGHFRVSCRGRRRLTPIATGFAFTFGIILETGAGCQAKSHRKYYPKIGTKVLLHLFGFDGRMVDMKNTHIAGQITYSVYYDTETKTPIWACASFYFPTLEEARAYAAQFAKSIRVIAGPLSGCQGFEGCGGIDVKLRSDKTIGTVNETGIKRFQNFLRTCKKLGTPVVYVMNAGNSYPETEAIKVISEVL